MPSTVPRDLQRATSAAPDDLDALVDNYDQAVNDFLRDIPIDRNTTSNGTTAPTQPSRDVDEEIKVRKQRKPVAKLDEARLLLDAGIPKLKRIAKTRLKFKGKGHEFKDMESILNMYQLWLDDLYPKAKFRDALTMVEKLGHSKSMQVRRKAWMDVTKPSRQDDVDRVGQQEDVMMSGALGGGKGPGHEDAARQASVGDAEARQRPANGEPNHESMDEVPEQDELDALMAGNHGLETAQLQTQPAPRTGPFDEEVDDGPDEDELDALLAEQHVSGFKERNATRRSPVKSLDDAREDDFGDDEEAMATMTEGW